MLTDAEKDACVILSDFFLDTELTPADLHTIAASLQRLSLSVSILNHLLRYDVFPILYPNLMSAAGIWDVFARDWLLSQIESRRSTPPGWAKLLLDYCAWLLVGRLCVTPVWDQVKQMLQGKL